jgi:hypothetical protein
MATTGNDWPSLLDVTKSLDPDGRPAEIAEIMEEVNPILEDMPMIEGNLMTGHQGTVRAGIPTPTWRLLNYGTLPTKGQLKTVTDTCGMLEAYSNIDKEVYNLNGAKDSFRMSEDEAHIQGMSLELADTLIHGNIGVTPEKFMGLVPRFNSLSAENGGQIVNAAGASSDNTSIWMIAWGKKTIHGIYPKGSMAGLEHQNLGEVTHVDPSTGRMMQVYRSHFLQKIGLHVKDWGGVARMANIDVSNLLDGTTTSTVFINLLLDLVHKVPPRLRGSTRRVLYCNQTVETMLNKLALDRTVTQLTVDKLKNGEPVTKFWGIPIRVCEAILNTEGLAA